MRSNINIALDMPDEAKISRKKNVAENMLNRFNFYQKVNVLKLFEEIMCNKNILLAYSINHKRRIYSLNEADQSWNDNYAHQNH